MKLKLTRVVAFLLMVTMIGTCLAGCGKTVNNGTEEASVRTVVDMAGDSIDIPGKIARVACHSSTCEAAIISLGKADVLVGTTDYTDEDSIAYELFPELQSVKKCGDDMSVEEMLQDEVQVVFVKDLNKVEQYQNAGLNVVYLNFDTISGTKEAISIMGDILGVSDRAGKCIEYIDKYEQLVSKRLSSSDSESFSAYYSRAKYEESNLLTTYAAGHIYSEWIGECSGTVITKDMDLKETKGGVLINGEELITIDPDIIFIGGYYRNSVLEEAINGEYNNILKAIKDGSVYLIPTSVTDWSVGSCEIGLVTLWCAKMVYPDLFSDIDMVEEIMMFYRDVAGINVSEDLAKAILNSTDY